MGFLVRFKWWVRMIVCMWLCVFSFCRICDMCVLMVVLLMNSVCVILVLLWVLVSSVSMLVFWLVRGLMSVFLFCFWVCDV